MKSYNLMWKDRHGRFGNLDRYNCTVPVTLEVHWSINLGVMQPGALVEEAAGVSDLQARGYTSLEAEF